MAIADALFRRLVDEGRSDEEFALHVLAACAGTEALDALIDDGVPTPAPTRGAAGGADADAVAPVYLSSISVRAFRGIGDESLLRPAPGPGVTLVVGRNGSGKSSFAEAAEVAFTGTSARWTDKKTVEWQQGWKNVHGAHAPRLVVELNQQGSDKPTRVERTWPDPADVRSGRTVVIWPSGSREPVGDTAWSAALLRYRPFLSYSELGGMLNDGPSRIYEALLAGLGLDDLRAVRERLSTAHTVRRKQVDDVKKAGDQLLTVAQALGTQHPDESRFAALAALLTKRTRDVDAIAALVTTTAADPGSRHLDALVSLAPPVTAARAAELASLLRERHRALQEARGRTEGLAYGLSKLLREALDYAETASPATCPVCESPAPLDAKWRAATSKRLEAIDQASVAVKAAQDGVASAIREAHVACAPIPSAVVEAARASMAEAEAVRRVWERWSAGSTLIEPEALAAHLETSAGKLATRIEALVAAARAEIAKRDAVWQPFALQVAQWVALARGAERARAAQAPLKAAKDWLDATIDRERDERFAPVRAQAIRYWNDIADQSNVTLEDIELEGRGTQRRVTLRVAVDGTAAPALGVLSQGELNAMTLSLFLPRLLLDETPFGFVLVDDPVQAMDEARVDGLARVLADVGQRRQVVVFTHDARLPEAFERLALPHSKVRVTRGVASKVSVSSLEGAWQQRLKDALAVALTEDLPESLGGQVVPNFCRAAIEAACYETLRRRWLQRGDNHLDVEERLASARKVREVLAFVFFEQARDLSGLNARLGKFKTRDAAALVDDCSAGTHSGFPGDLTEMVNRTRSLCEEIRKVKAP